MGDTHCNMIIEWEIPTAINFQQIYMALFTSFLTLDTSDYNYKHNVLLFKEFICAPVHVYIISKIMWL